MSPIPWLFIERYNYRMPLRLILRDKFKKNACLLKYSVNSLAFSLHSVVLGLLSVAVTNSMNDSSLGRKGLIWLTCPGNSSSWREGKIITEATRELGITEERCFLHAQSAFSDTPRASAHAMAPPTIGLRLLAPITN